MGLQLSQILEYSDSVLADVALSPSQSRSCMSVDDEPLKKPRDEFGKPPTTGGKRPSLALGKVRPNSPIEHGVKTINLDRLHMFSYASTLDDQVSQIEKRTAEKVETEKFAIKELKAFKRSCLEQALEARRVRENEEHSRRVKQAQNLISG